jgi:hypothetical protein
MEVRPDRNRTYSPGVLITAVKAITRRIYHNSERELRQEPFGGKTTRRILTLTLSTLHGKLRPHKGRGVHISLACAVSSEVMLI